MALPTYTARQQCPLTPHPHKSQHSSLTAFSKHPCYLAHLLLEASLYSIDIIQAEGTTNFTLPRKDGSNRGLCCTLRWAGWLPNFRRHNRHRQTPFITNITGRHARSHQNSQTHSQELPLRDHSTHPHPHRLLRHPANCNTLQPCAPHTDRQLAHHPLANKMVPRLLLPYT